jgi:selenocysteine-specific elongation factor
MRHVILGTAGHIDHGKTTLVKALTGTDTDRLPEEKARGITIDLGFAHLQLDDLDIGIVDVPGHEALIRNMLAGATGFDAVLLVIAADEGVMPQTREHVAIAEMLGVHRVVVALTKTDMVEPEWLDLVAGDARSLVSAIAPDADVIPVSAVSGSGFDALRSALVRQLSQAQPRATDDLFRMPIDRVFTVRGTGTVVTGTIWTGACAHHDEVRIEPGARTVRIRGVQTHGNAVARAGAGERSAFALSGIDHNEVSRGQTLITNRQWHPVQQLTARVTTLDAPLKSRQRVRIHLGTAEVMARVVLFDEDWVQLRLETPMLARAHDRFVLRSYSPVRTIGGGVIAELGRIRKRLTADEMRALQTIVDGDVAQRIRAAIDLAGSLGVTLDDLPVVTGVTPTRVTQYAGDLPGDVAKVGDRLFGEAILADTVGKMVRRVKRFHDAHPLERGIERALLLAEVAPVLAQAALMRAETEGKLQSAGSVVLISGFEPGFTPKQKILRDQIVEELIRGGLAPPTVQELTANLRSNEVRSVLRLLELEGVVAGVSHDMYVHAAALASAIRVVRSELGAGARSAADFRTAMPVSRKYLIPLLEYLDRSGVTRREGDLRWVVAAAPEGEPQKMREL